MGMASGNDPTKNALEKPIQSNYDGAFEGAAASIRQAWQQNPDLTDVQDNLRIEETADGLDIQIMDAVGRPMFPEGSKYPFEYTRQAIAAIAPILSKLPNQIRISGHTASGSTYTDPRYGAWELSSDRANMVRMILGEFGLADDHVESVIGRAATQPLLPSDPYLSANQRISILLLNAAPPVPPGLKP
jgi:chemotaxis protein MotB